MSRKFFGSFYVVVFFILVFIRLFVHNSTILSIIGLVSGLFFIFYFVYIGYRMQFVQFPVKQVTLFVIFTVIISNVVNFVESLAIGLDITHPWIYEQKMLKGLKIAGITLNRNFYIKSLFIDLVIGLFFSILLGILFSFIGRVYARRMNNVKNSDV